jgi:hypothetical protein
MGRHHAHGARLPERGGRAPLTTKRRISTKDLATYVVSGVSALAKAMDGHQERQYFRARDADDYVLAQ